MLECLILGDSIAYGISNIRKECISYARSGINSHTWNQKFSKAIVPAETVIISLGSNDLRYIDTYVDLVNIRKKVKAERVFWILPAIKPNVQKIVRLVAEENNDQIIEIKSLQKDQIHPSYKGYIDLANQTK